MKLSEYLKPAIGVVVGLWLAWVLIATGIKAI